MGSICSTPESPHRSSCKTPEYSFDQLDHTELQRQRAQLEEEKKVWQHQQERHWKTHQELEEQARKKAVLEWERQVEVKQLKLRLQELQKKLEEQKLERQTEEEKIRKLLEEQLELKLQQQSESKKIQKQSAEQRKQPQPALLQRVELQSNNQTQFPNRRLQEQRWPTVCPTTTSTSRRPWASLVVSEVVVGQQKAPSDATNSALPNPQKPIKSHVTTRTLEPSVKCAEWTIIDYVKDDNSINKITAENILKLFDDGNTVPFIARYRKHLTQGMDGEGLRKVSNSYEQAKLTKKLARAVVEILDEKGKCTPELRAYVQETKSLLDLKHVQSIFKKAPSKSMKKAEKLGLRPLAQLCMENKEFPPLLNLVNKSVDGLRTVEYITDRVVSLMADIIVKDRRIFDIMARLRSKHSMEIETTKGKTENKFKDTEYEAYYNFKSMESNLKASQVFAINKGESLNALIVKINVPNDFKHDFKQQCLQQFCVTTNTLLPNRKLMVAAIDVAVIRVRDYIATRTRREMTERAQNSVINDLTENIKEQVIAPPLRGKVVLGIRPSFSRGCKIAVVSEEGHVLETGEICPPDLNKLHDQIFDEDTLIGIISRHNCRVIALGNGEAWEETEIFLRNFLRNKSIAWLGVVYTIVDEWSATLYSNSSEATLEFPGVDPGVVSAIFIARRLQDPIRELAKIDLKLIVGHMANEDSATAEILAKINEVYVQIISDVGVDANTASLSLLKKVAGLDYAKATNIIEWRRSYGPFVNRNNLLQVTGMSERVFEQCAGFIRILPETAVSVGRERSFENSFNRFDQTSIHPESYDLAKSLVEAARCDVAKMGTSGFVCSMNLFAQTGPAILAQRFGTNAETIEFIIQALLFMKEGMDIRGNEDARGFCRIPINFEDLCCGAVLTGVVVGLSVYGAFINVGAEIDGFIHNRFMNRMTLHVGQKVEVRVGEISKELGRLRLRLVKIL